MLGFELFAVEFQFADEFTIEPATTESGQESPEHHSSDGTGLRRKRSITETVRSQLAASCAICLRPRAVSSYIFARRLLSEVAQRHLIQPRCSSRRSAGYSVP